MEPLQTQSYVWNTCTPCRQHKAMDGTLTHRAHNTKQWLEHLHTLQTTQGNGWNPCKHKAMSGTPAHLADNTRQWMGHLHTVHTTQSNGWNTCTPCRQRKAKADKHQAVDGRGMAGRPRWQTTPAIGHDTQPLRKLVVRDRPELRVILLSCQISRAASSITSMVTRGAKMKMTSTI